MFKRALVFLATVAGAVLVLGAAASAQYALPSTLEQTGGGAGCVPGSPVTFTVDGAAPGAEVTFVFESDPVVLGVATADATGAAVLETSWPDTASEGAHTVTAQGLDGDGNALDLAFGATCSVAGEAGAAGAGALARTGSDALPVTQVAVVLVAIGGLVLLAAHRRAAAVAVAEVHETV